MTPGAVDGPPAKVPMPRVGVGVIVENRDGLILVGRRLGTHAPYVSILGGHLETGETFHEAACRETLEETGLVIRSSRVVALTNNLETFAAEGVHYVSVILHTSDFDGEPALLEPDRCEGWFWADPADLPLPHFEPSRIGVRCWLEGRFTGE